MRSLACWGRWFESRRGHGSLSVVSVVGCQVEVSPTGRSLVQISLIKYRVSECDFETPTRKRLRPTGDVEL
jgi:hypothetical protein